MVLIIKDSKQPTSRIGNALTNGDKTMKNSLPQLKSLHENEKCLEFLSKQDKVSFHQKSVCGKFNVNRLTLNRLT